MASNKVRLYVNKRARGLIRSVVERNGTRAIDTGVFTVPHSVPITKGDDVAYVQDPVDTTHLTGIWNFFDNTRDESGHELDGAEDATYVTDATYDNKCNGRALKFNLSPATTKAVKIVDRASTSTILKLMDFSGQFDVILWYSNFFQTGVLFGKGTNSTKVQIEVIANHYVKATIGSTVITGTNKPVSGSTNDSSGFHFIRLKRDENDLVTLSVDGTTEGTATVAGVVAATSTNLYIGGDWEGDNLPIGYFAQVRLYNGGYLSDEDFTTLRQTRRQPNTIKFGGTVWKIDEQPTHKVAHCKGYSRILHDTIISTSAHVVPPNGWTTSSDIYKNIFTDKNGFEILTELMRAYTGTGTNSVKTVDVAGDVTSAGDYVEYKAVGTLFSNVVLISMNTATYDSSFSIDGRKILRLEDKDIDYTQSADGYFSPILFKNGHIKVRDLGYDDTSVVTQVVGYTQIPIVEKTVTKTVAQFEDYASTKLDMKLGHETPISITISVVQNDGGTPTLTNVANNTGGSQYPDPTDLTEYKIIKKTTGYNHAIFGGSAEHNSDVYTAVYKHEDIFPNTGRNHYYSASGNNLDPAIGTYHKILYLPQLTKAGGLGLLGFLNRFVNRFQELNRRFLVTSPTLINHIRENYKVRVGDDFHGQAHDIDTPNNDLKTMVKSVKYLYPEGITEINCGEHMLDAYDIDNAFGTALHELRSTLSHTETSS